MAPGAEGLAVDLRRRARVKVPGCQAGT